MRGLIFLPTYNESSNIVRLIEEILRQGLDVEILVVDDDSPDGTAQLAGELGKRDSRVHVMVRKDKRGRGLAGIDGFREAVKMPVDYVVEMDADFSHDPAYLPRFIPAIEHADVVIASRLILGGGEPGRGLLRKAMTRLACWWIRFWLAVPVADGTSGFRCFRKSILAKIDWDKMVSVGPSIVEELLWAAHGAGARIAEIPLVFQPRAAGKSQLNVRKLLDAFLLVSSFRFKSLPIKK